MDVLNVVKREKPMFNYKAENLQEIITILNISTIKQDRKKVELVYHKPWEDFFKKDEPVKAERDI